MDPGRDESLIIELLDLKLDVADSGSATWFLQDLANEQDAEGATVSSFFSGNLFFCSLHFCFIPLLSAFRGGEYQICLYELIVGT